LFLLPAVPLHGEEEHRKKETKTDGIQLTPAMTQLAIMAAVLLGVGLCGGILAGLLGVGGGIVIVPVLYHLMSLLDIDSDVAMKLAVGTSLATIIPTSIVSMRSHLRKDAVDIPLLKNWGPAIAVGVVLIGIVKGEVMIGVFAVTAAAVAIHMAFAPEGLRLADHLPSGVPRFGIGMLIGVVSTMMGIGGGTLTVPTLVLCNYPIRRAVGTASAIGLIIAFPGTIGAIIGGWGSDELPPWSLGNVSLIALVILAPATMLAAPWGAKLAHSIKTRNLRRAFALFLGITSVRMFIDLLT
jgi:uncharacterized membrane protein YfcA